MRILLTAVLACGAAVAAEEGVLFEDDLKGELGEGWEWLRADEADWRVTAEGLEIQLRPGDANTVKNALVRPLPESKGPIALEVTVAFLAEPTEQYEQAGITWYRKDKPVFKLVHERVDGNLVVVPGKVPAEKMTVRLRLLLKDGRFTAQFRQEAEEEFQTAAEGELAVSDGDRISLQGYHGPAETAHWVRFSDFVVKETE